MRESGVVVESSKREMEKRGARKWWIAAAVVAGAIVIASLYVLMGPLAPWGPVRLTHETRNHPRATVVARDVDALPVAYKDIPEFMARNEQARWASSTRST
jgi:cytochrome c-type biogenesis protein CcmH/NrfG